MAEINNYSGFLAPNFHCTFLYQVLFSWRGNTVKLRGSKADHSPWESGQ